MAIYAVCRAVALEKPIMRTIRNLFVAVTVLCGIVATAVFAGSTTTSESVQPNRTRVSVLLELFTSEGCSSCPPADRLLESLDRQSPADADVIVLSEHVDYWNYLGWADPYSSAFFSGRQRKYADRLGATVYTPQLVVDGHIQTLGSDRLEVTEAISRSAQMPKLPMSVRATRSAAGGSIRVEANSGGKDADLYIAIATDHARSQVTRGENGGHFLSHVAVARAIVRVGKWDGTGLAGRDVSIMAKQYPAAFGGVTPGDIRVVAILQDPQSGRILGVAQTRL